MISLIHSNADTPIHSFTHIHACGHTQDTPPSSVSHEEENKHAPVFPIPVPMSTGLLWQLKCGGGFHEGWIIEQAQWVFQRNDSRTQKENPECLGIGK